MERCRKNKQVDANQKVKETNPVIRSLDRKTENQGSKFRTKDRNLLQILLGIKNLKTQKIGQ